MDLKIKKINDNTYRICDVNNKLFKINIPIINAPFGIENFTANLEINLSKSHHPQLLGDLNKIEIFLKEYVYNIDKNIIWRTSIKKRINYMLKVKIAKKGLECFKDKSFISIYDLNLKNDCSIELVLQSLWIRNNNAGIIWEIKKIKELY
jgi:hypothetical protein